MSKQENSSKLHKTLTIIGIVMCVILIPILIINVTLIVKSFVNKDEVPSFGGTVPFIVLTDSMSPDIKGGDLIICKKIDAKDVTVDMVISFYDPAGNGTSVVTHKVIEVIDENGALFFRTKGINNNDADKKLVPAKNVIAEYTGIHFGYVGYVAIFMQSTEGLLICIILPIILFVGYDMIRRKKYEKNKNADMAVLMAELEALRSMQNEPQDGEQVNNEEKSE